MGRASKPVPHSKNVCLINLDNEPPWVESVDVDDCSEGGSPTAQAKGICQPLQVTVVDDGMG
jgi:hypothetical protein